MDTQPTFSLSDNPPTVDQVLAAIRRIRAHPVAYETDLYPKIAAELTAAGIPFEREVRLGPRNRIDFLVAGGIGIEVKKGKPPSMDLIAQAIRYCMFDQVTAMILVVERCAQIPSAELSGKPVHYISLNRLWGIAL